MKSWSRLVVLSQFSYVCLVHSVIGMRTSEKIYINLKTQNACILNLNGTHEIGCKSQRGGNVGAIYYIQSQDDYEWVLRDGPHAPYVVVLKSVDFNMTSLERLYRSPRVVGILIITPTNLSLDTSYPQLGYSSVDTCPNDKYGMYAKSTYAQCRKTKWNRSGTSARLQDLQIPVFELSHQEDVDQVLGTCFHGFNAKSVVYPVCAAELVTKMEAAVDSVTCWRRSQRVEFLLSESKGYCDPLGDKNVVATMKAIPSNETRFHRSVVMAVTRMDATSIFQNTNQAADTAVAGIVTMLATAEALWKVRDVIRNDSMAKDIMFVFFQGETFDYIGSSRMVYDMEQETFPCDSKNNPDNVRNIELEHIDQIVEVNQVGHISHGGYMWVHTDPLNFGYVRLKVQQMITELKTVGKGMNVNFAALTGNTPLPPASTQRFLMKKPIPAVVLTDHFEYYTNKFYNSRFDTGYHIGANEYPDGLAAEDKYFYVTEEARLLANLSSTLAQYLFKASTGKSPSPAALSLLTADPMTVTQLLYCFLITPDCDMFYDSLTSTLAKNLKERQQPLSFYVGTTHEVSNITTLVHNIMARFTGTREQYSEDWCISKRSKMYRHVWMQGAVNMNGKRMGWCYKSLVFLTEAISPAFKITDYDLNSGNFSSWTESRWETYSLSVRLFLLPSRQYQIVNLVVGVMMLTLSMIAVYVCVQRSEILFDPAY